MRRGGERRRFGQFSIEIDHWIQVEIFVFDEFYNDTNETKHSAKTRTSDTLLEPIRISEGLDSRDDSLLVFMSNTPGE